MCEACHTRRPAPRSTPPARAPSSRERVSREPIAAPEAALARGTTRLFGLFETHGLPVELAVEELRGHGVRVNGWRDGFDASVREHRERSRAGAEARFA